MNQHYQRALLLFEQNRHDLAEQELNQALAVNPNDADAHALLALCLAKRQDFQRATEEAQMAIHLAPDLSFAHYALASILEDRNHYPEARRAVADAIRLAPETALYHGLEASIRFNERDWPGALAAAERGLAIDAENVGCNNLRAMALVKLGRPAEAGATIAAALARDPEDAASHANLGWMLLEQRQPDKAMEHFREALRLNPQFEWARAGIVEALKARHFVYRWMLMYFLFMAKLSGTAQWAIILGGYFGQRFLSEAAAANPELRPFVLPIIVAYVVFALLTWLASPLFNLLLRLSKFGRLALSEEQIFASNCVGGCLLAAVLALGLWLATGSALALFGALYLGLLTLPVSVVFNCPAGWPRQAMTAYVVALLGVAALALANIFGEAFPGYNNLFFLGILASGFVVNGLAMTTVRR